MFKKALIVIGLLGMSGSSLAQSVTTEVTDTGFRTQELVDDTLLDRGRMELGVNLAGAFTAAGAKDDAWAQLSRTYANPDIRLGYMLTDRVQLRGAIGYQHRSAQASGQVLERSHSVTETAQVLYHHPLPLGLAWYVGAGVGGYQGVSDRPTSESGVLERSNAFGAVGQGLTGLLVQPGALLTLRGGLRAEGSVGLETFQQSRTWVRSATLIFEFGVAARF